MIRFRPGFRRHARPADTGLPENIKKIVMLERSKRSEAHMHQELSAYFIEHAYSKTAKAIEPFTTKIEQVERHRKAARRTAPDHAGLSRKGRRAQAGVSAQARRI